jgi:DNA-binding LacI/PurR family transcriptional regulator
VSLVINHASSVSDETVRAVRKAMAEIGYVPPPPGKRRGPKRGSKRRARVLNIALLTFGLSHAVTRSPVYADVLHGIEEATRERGHRLTIYRLPASDVSPTGAARVKADGFVLFGRCTDPSLAERLSGRPCVSVMYYGGEFDWADWISYDNAAIGPMAARYLLSNGHKHCAYLGRANAGTMFEERCRGFTRAVREGGGEAAVLTDDKLIVLDGDVHDVDRARLGTLVDALLALRPRPTGVFVPADMTVAALHPMLLARGVDLDRDLDIISCNNEWPFRVGLHPRPAVIDIQASTIGRRAVQRLLGRVKNRDETRVKVLLAPMLIPGGDSAQEGRAVAEEAVG